MGRRTYLTHVALILGLAALVPQSICKPQGWSLPKLQLPQNWNQPKLQLPQTPVFSPGQLPIDCTELAADPSIPAFLIQELCSPPSEHNKETVAEANGQEDAVETKEPEGAAEVQGQEEAAQAQEGAAQDQGQDGASNAQGQEGAAQAQGQEGSDQAQGQEGAAQAEGQEGAAQAQGQGGSAQAQGQEGSAQAQGQDGSAQSQGQEGAGQAQGQEGAAQAQGQEGSDQAQGQEGAAQAQGQEGAAQTEGQKRAENAAKEQTEPAVKPTGKHLSSGGAQEPSQVIVPFFRVVIQKLVSTDRKVPAREFWAKAYQEAGAPKLTRHPTFFEIVAGLQQAVESFRSEDSWWAVVDLIKDLTSDKHWKRLEAAVIAAHGRDRGNLWKALGAAKALKVALKSSIAEPECRVEGLNPDPEDCRQFLFCYHFQGRWKSNDVKCPKYTEFSPSRLKCVWAPLSDCVEQSDSDSDEDSNSDESSREVLERILKHGSGAFHVQ